MVISDLPTSQLLCRTFMGLASPWCSCCAGYQLRSLLVHQTFKKVLYISPAVRSDFSSGRVFNLVTSDAETLQLLCQNIMGLISSPLRIIVAMAMLYFGAGRQLPGRLCSAAPAHAHAGTFRYHMRLCVTLTTCI